MASAASVGWLQSMFSGPLGPAHSSLHCDHFRFPSRLSPPPPSAKRQCPWSGWLPMMRFGFRRTNCSFTTLQVIRCMFHCCHCQRNDFFVYVRTLYGQTSVASRFMFVQCTFSGRCCLVLLVLAPRWFRKSTSRHLLYLLVDLCQGLFAAWWQQPCWLQFEVNLNNLCLGNLLLLKAFRWPLANYKDVMRPERKRCSWSSERKA